jgi:hypothetical protein
MKYTVYWTETADSTLDCILQMSRINLGLLLLEN